MSSPISTPNVFDPYNNLSNYFKPTDLFEKRFENDGNGNPIYIGYTPYPNHPTSSNNWFIVKITYAGENITRYQLPDEGLKFSYSWDQRATYFS